MSRACQSAAAYSRWSTTATGPSFGRAAHDQDQVGYIGSNTRAIFERSYAAEPDVLIKQLAADEAIAAADTLLLRVPNQLGVDYNAHAIDSILKLVAPERLALTALACEIAHRRALMQAAIVAPPSPAELLATDVSVEATW